MAVSPDPTLRPPPPTLSIRADDFDKWLERAAPGQRLEYHRGHLVADRTRGLSPFDDRERAEIAAVANRALALAEKGRLLLVQRRHGVGDYSYVAVKAKPAQRRRPAPLPIDMGEPQKGAA